MQYVPTLVFASVTLVDPVVTALISWVFGIEHLPGLFSWLGGGVVIAGVAVISYGEQKRELSASMGSSAHTDRHGTPGYAASSRHNSKLSSDVDDDDGFSSDDQEGNKIELQILQQ